ncbi:MAG: DsbA family oxidoreductase [Actinobacteria bacterium]|nr:DsbA family oxidoreductase [Actinomycetota bacterium]
MARRFGARVEWLPFDLHPEYPPEGIPRARLAERYGDSFDERTREVIELAGFPYDPPETIPNSRKALAVTELAREQGLHDAVHDRLMRAYWSEGRDIGDDGVLLDLVTAAGLDRAEAAEAMTTDEYHARVVASTQEANRHGIDAIPAFVIDRRLLVLGAHPHEAFEQAFALLEKEEV